ncbi:hypothetical protein O181_006373 [Austropuccinia psidii MF-1]|uniref:DNA topoisomerase n=1 Tax=Austropuccinia psidii MF-1 TaxID=1389203 RepID=A0A9Q3GGI9_9BASI|nr:hypothetical protein [Austropuccinia psidii MF-1]
MRLESRNAFWGVCDTVRRCVLVLCVAEKPSIAKSITEILSGSQFTTRQSLNRFVKNYDFTYRLPPSPQFANFTVTSVLGHLTQSNFGNEYKSWNGCDPFVLFDAPINHFINPDHKGIERNLHAEARRADRLMIWTDCDREGEHIGSEIVSVCRKVNPGILISRARFSAIIPAQIHNACQTAGQLDMRQAYAVETRIELDLRIGAALTRSQTLGLQPRFAQLANNVISYGPCQFPTLGFVVDQYEKVKAFVPEPFWYIYIVFEKDGSTTEFKWKRHRLFDWHAAFVLYEMCADNPRATIKDIQLKPAVKWKPLPLTTVELQKSGSRLLHLTPKVILDIAEKLYQKGLVSYPRTETDQFDRDFDFMALIEKQMNDAQWGGFATKLKNEGGFQTPRNGKKNDKAHPPIHPTAHANNLNADEKRVYDFITRRYLACCSKNAVGKTTTVEISITNEEFVATGLVIIERNYLEVYVYDKWSGNTLPDFQTGETFIPSVCELKEGSTTRPNLLTEADLVSLMDKNGIGTDATIAEHIAKIIERNYVFKTREGATQYLVPSTLGIGLVEGYNAIGLDKSLSKPQLRRETERRMSRICEGSRSKGDVLTQTIDEYRDVFLRTKRAFATIIEQVGKYLNLPAEGDNDGAGNDSGGTSAGEDDGDDGNAGGNRGGAARRRGRGRRPGTRGTNRQRGIGRQPSSDDDSESGHNGNSGITNSRTESSRGRRGGRVAKGEAKRSTNAVKLTKNLNSNAQAKPKCQCGAEVVERVVKKEGPNKGRLFYVCPKPQDEKGCGFQGWVDDAGVGGNQPKLTNAGTSHKRLEAGTSVDFPPSRRAKIDKCDTSSVLHCNCGLEASRKTVSKEGPTKGRIFWVCSKVAKKAQCKFFKWDEEVNEMTVAVSGPSRTTVESHIGGFGLQSNPAFQESNYTCFFCNEQGHLSTNCPLKGKSTVDNTGLMGGINTCYHCGHAGHWASSCPAKSNPEGSSRGKDSSTRGQSRGIRKRGQRGFKKI